MAGGSGRTTPRRRPAPGGGRELDEAFAALKAILARHAYHLSVVHDLPDHYYLQTRKPGPDGQPAFFGSVERLRDHVRFALAPLATDAALAASLSAPLRRHLRGKRAFHFVALDPAAAAELDRITRAALASYQRRGLA
ncbi:MAG: hypothetical protein N2688_09420 [Burkholderiaceae bacterium]|nr:hypothetical protein [Burkholderiaceae bacterium]